MGDFDFLPTAAEVDAMRKGKPISTHKRGQKLPCIRCGKLISNSSPSRRAMYCGRACYALSRKRTKARATCLVCGKPAPNTHQRSCSKKCADQLRATTPMRTCVVCSKLYRPKGKIRLKYCSIRCYNVVRSGDAFELFNCDHCGKERKRRKVRTRPRPHKFCSAACRLAFYVGEKSTQWRGGSDPNRGTGWLKLAEQIRQRDGYRCQRCNRTQEENKQKLSVDHIQPWRSFESAEKANDPSNLVSLCRKCHSWKTSGAERKMLKGDNIQFQQYRKSIALPPTYPVVFKEHA